MNTYARSLCAIAALTAAVAEVKADTVDVQFKAFGAGQSVRVTAAGQTHYLFAGQLRNQMINGTGAGAGLAGEVITYLADVNQRPTTDTINFRVTPPEDVLTPAIGSFKAEALRELYTFADGRERASDVDSSFAAAFQLAVWEIVYDFDSESGGGSLDIDTGNFTAQARKGAPLSGAIRKQLAGFFNAALSMGPTTSTLYGLFNESAPDQLVFDQVMQAVPMPGAGVLGLAGLGAIASRRRRR